MTMAKQMRDKKALAGLKIDRSNLPTGSGAFGAYKAELRRLINENFGYQAAESLEYDEDAQDFFFRLRAYVAHLDGAALYAEQAFTIKPVDLLPEFARVATEIDGFQAAQVRAGQAICKIGGEIR